MNLSLGKYWRIHFSNQKRQINGVQKKTNLIEENGGEMSEDGGCTTGIEKNLLDGSRR